MNVFIYCIVLAFMHNNLVDNENSFTVTTFLFFYQQFVRWSCSFHEPHVRVPLLACAVTKSSLSGCTICRISIPKT